MSQPYLFHESINDALRECIGFIGKKEVAARLWPEKSVIDAQRLLSDCLNDDRPARLNPEQFMYVLKLARDKGCHAGMNFLCRELGYSETQPIEPRDEVAELQRQYIESAKAMARMAERIELLNAVQISLRSAG